MSPSISRSDRQDSSTTLHEAMDAPIKQQGLEMKTRPALSRGDTGSTRVEPADPPANCPCGALQTRSLADIAENGNTCNRQCTDIVNPQGGEKLQVTDEERKRAPPFCEMTKIISGKGEQLIYVGWNGPDDPANPRNWDLKRKWIIVSVGCLFCSIVSLSFSAYSIAINDISARLNTSYLLAVAGVSLFTLTFGVAPLGLAPLSEVSMLAVLNFFLFIDFSDSVQIWGRRLVYIGSAVVYTVFQIPQALATNIETMLVARFIAGIGGSTAVAVLGGTLADLFSNEQRGVPMAIFATVAFASTSVAPGELVIYVFN